MGGVFAFVEWECFLAKGAKGAEVRKGMGLEVLAKEGGYGHHELELSESAEPVAFFGEDAGFVGDLEAG